MHIECTGQGHPVVLLHGWGFNSAIWASVVSQLTDKWQVYTVDLPGHGHSPMHSYQLADLTAALAQQLPKPAIWVGWSLGGLIALAMSHYQAQSVKALGLIASTPCFVTRADWQPAMQPAVLSHFGQQLQTDPAATLKRFLSLQLKGTVGERQQLRQLQNFLKNSPLPQAEALQAGLDLLMTTDLRAQLAKTHCKSWAILGQRDTLIPAQVGQAIQHIHPNLRVVYLKSAGHLPFLSDPALFMHYLNGYLHDSILT